MAGHEEAEREGPASAFEFPCFKGEDWGAFEKIIEAALSNEARGEIEQAANQCVVERFFMQQDKHRIDHQGRVDSKGNTKVPKLPLNLLKAIGKLLKLWTEIQEMEKKQGINTPKNSDAKLVIDTYSKEIEGAVRHNLDGLMGELQLHESALTHFMGQRKSRDPFIGFVGRLAKVFETATGKKSGIAIPPDNEDPEARLSPFVNFIIAVDGCLPKAAQKPGVDTPLAISTSAKRAFKKYKDGVKSP